LIAAPDEEVAEKKKAASGRRPKTNLEIGNLSPNRGRGRRSRATIAGIPESAEAEQHGRPGRRFGNGGGHDNLDAASAHFWVLESEKKIGVTVFP
jgi:hypothetical protein